MRYIGAISDTDILINLAKVNRLDVLEYLFKEIIIPQYIYI
jgi:predicted nucleic acid-binding protein